MGDYALSNAAVTGNLAKIRELVERGEGWDVQDALWVAAEKGYLAMVRYLVGECRANVNEKDRIKGRTVLMWSARAGKLEVVRYLVDECGAKVNVKDEFGWTPLMWAAEHGEIEVVRYLAGECGADINVQEAGGHSSLMWAARYGYIEVVRYLVEQKCHASTKDRGGRTALMFAIETNKVEVVRYLVEQSGVDVNAKSNDGRTAFRIAADCGHHEVQRILTPFLMLPAPQPRTSGTTSRIASAAQTSDCSRSCSIPASEVELLDFCENSDIGGEYRAKWLDADAVVKLFILDASKSVFEEEIHLWQRLRHPNVIKMYGACDAGLHVQFFVCEYASKGSLSEYVRSHSSEERPTMWKFLHEAALGLEYLHERGLVHGALRCSNILIGTDGMAKLSNFGVSGSVKGPGIASSGVVVSLRWQSPEVLKGHPPSFASDVYSLGMCILEAVTKEVPWSKEQEFWVENRKSYWTPEKNANVNVDTHDSPACPSGDARDIVWRMCCSDPAKRARLSCVVRELEGLALKESASHSQPEHDPPSIFDDHNYGEREYAWMCVQTYMKHCDNELYHQAYDELQKARGCLLHSTHPSTVFDLFHSLVADFRRTITMSKEQARVLQLSATRTTSSSILAFRRRLRSLWASLGESVDVARERESRWEKQRSKQIEIFVSEAEKSYLLLEELQSEEERAAFLIFLKEEMGHPSKYTSGQLGVLQNAYQDIESKVETNDLSELTPEWFIPWYELEIVDKHNPLGRGGFGGVFRGKWLDSDVVVKILLGEGEDMDVPKYSFALSIGRSAPKRKELLTMFRREVDIWFGFSHPHVVRLFGACHVGRPFFVCEYATNGTLVSYLAKHPDQMWAKLYEAALGVQYLHARGVLHGDLKGNNIVIGSDRKTKVTDFGLSSITSDDGNPRTSAAAHWMAPEYFLGEKARPSCASDVYSLGMCVVEALRVVEAVQSGEEDLQRCLPWGVLDNDVVKHHVKQKKLPSRPATCDDAQWQLVKRMCVFDPDNRMKISTVVAELARLAEIPPMNQTEISTGTPGGLDAALQVISAAREQLTRLQDNNQEAPNSDGGALRTLYGLLWDRLEQVHRSKWISRVWQISACCALSRRLDKFEDAYFLLRENKCFCSTAYAV
ncbi:Kinase D-interacting substrate of 220 kDa [Phytophthora ramorum]|uniref:Kinase D-interacting substrate of 220 kDa n=1 Tax=Phytophthora ramorum TaxID=164328 RepID=UPI00309DEB46|nr:Kinase D-interacting substrate of 220 kDa [Phytophthora ramorum]